MKLNMALYRIPRNPIKKHNSQFPKKGNSVLKKASNTFRFKITCLLLKELWLYSINPSSIILSPEASNLLKRLAMDRGLPPDYFFTGFSAFNTNIEALKLYRHLANRIWEYNEKLFLEWWQNWLQWHLKLFLKKKRMGLLRRRRKKGWDPIEALRQEEEEEDEIYRRPSLEMVDTLWVAGLNAIKHMFKQRPSALEQPLATQQECELKWETLYNYYSRVNKSREKIQFIISEYQSSLEKTHEKFPEESPQLFEQLGIKLADATEETYKEMAAMFEYMQGLLQPEVSPVSVPRVTRSADVVRVTAPSLRLIPDGAIGNEQ
jgi:hypothetical protein